MSTRTDGKLIRLAKAVMKCGMTEVSLIYTFRNIEYINDPSGPEPDAVYQEFLSLYEPLNPMEHSLTKALAAGYWYAKRASVWAPRLCLLPASERSRVGGLLYSYRISSEDLFTRALAALHDLRRKPKRRSPAKSLTPNYLM